MGTVNLGQWSNGNVTLTATHLDTGNKRIVEVICDNNSDSNLRATILDPDNNNLLFQTTFLSRRQTVIPVSGGKPVKVDADGSFEFPYIFRAQYPAP